MTDIRITALQAEHHESGFGIGHPAPRLSWRFDASQVQDWTQEGYEIVIIRSGKHEEQYKINLGESVLVPWPSQPLASRESARVRVRAIGNDDKVTNWAEIDVEAALLERSDWKGTFISRSRQSNEETKRPFYLSKTFYLSFKPTSARLYSTALGVYEVEINGNRVGDEVLSPGWQSYHHHLNYQTYDITPLLKDGENTIRAYIGEGWYAGRLGRPGVRNIWGDRLGFLGQLEIDRNVEIVTDDSWEWSDGPILTSEFYDGESYDTTFDYSSASKLKVDLLPFPCSELIASDAPPVRRVKEVRPTEIITTPSGKKVMDFGQNLVGWVKIEKDVEGEELILRHAEVLEHGELGVRPLRTAKATDRIRLGGTTRGWEPRFTFHGFRYVEVSGTAPSLSDFTAVVVSSDMRRTGTFESSHAQLNRLHENVVWGMMSNFISVPTDCPQRDERLGWTGDIQVFAPTANFLFDTSGLLSGWLKDLAAEQKDFDGIVPTVVPHCKSGDHAPAKPHPHAVWADACAITPWDLYTSFGDTKILERQYESMKLWLDQGLPRNSKGLYDQNIPQYGDWLDPRAPPQYPAHGRTDTHLVANAYLVYTTDIVARIARLLGKEHDAKRYAEEASRYRQLFRNEYISPSGRLASDTQTAYALALKFSLLKPEQLETARERLDYLIRWEYFKISTGFAGTPILLPVLAENDLLHVAYIMLQEKDCPSWLYAVGMGATTIWERWDSMLPDGTINPGQMTSFNHYALGAVAQFLHNSVGGLAPLEPGWKKALIRPQPGGTVTNAKVSYDSPYGWYAVDWKIEGKQLKVEVVVPPNTRAKVVLPGLNEEIGSGKRKYVVDWQQDLRWPPKGQPGPQRISVPDEYIP